MIFFKFTNKKSVKLAWGIHSIAIDLLKHNDLHINVAQLVLLIAIVHSMNWDR